MKHSLLLASLLFVSSLNVFAEEAKTLSVREEVSISAPAAKVWSTVSNFSDLGAWHPAVKSTEIVSGENNKVGTVRLLTLQDGGTVKEKLLAYKAKGKTFKYSILEGVLPVSDYVSSVTVKADGKDKSLVVWEGRFKHKQGSDDDTAVKTMTSVYRGGLDNLKKISE